MTWHLVGTRAEADTMLIIVNGNDTGPARQKSTLYLGRFIHTGISYIHIYEIHMTMINEHRTRHNTIAYLRNLYI